MSTERLIAQYVTEMYISEAARPVQELGWSRLLAAANALYTLYYTSHWKAQGSMYYGDHLLYERLYKATFEDLDMIAEKAIGTTDCDSFITASKWAAETAAWIRQWDPEGSGDYFEFSLMLLGAEKDYIRLVSKFKKELERADLLTDGIDDFLQGLVNKHEGHIYLLQQRRGR